MLHFFNKTPAKAFTLPAKTKMGTRLSKFAILKHFWSNVLTKNPPVPFCSLLHVKNCVLYIDISVEFAFDSCVEISKFLKSGNRTENDGITLSILHRDTSLLGKVSRWNLSF